jgi:hypothetical protein
MHETREAATYLRSFGIEVTSTWLTETGDPNGSMKDTPEDFCKMVARQDVEDILRADDFVIFTVDTDTPTRRGGRHVETGIALASGKRAIVCGPRENVFHFLSGVTVCSTIEEVKDILLTKRNTITNIWFG